MQGYDYAKPGAYFVTICTQGRECLFGDIDGGEMRLNDWGRIVADEWKKSAEIRAEITLDEWVVMPNHFHGIVAIHGAAPHDICRGDRPVGPTACERTVGPQLRSVGAMMAGFKSVVAKRVNALRQIPGGKLWQRNYWEDIIRDESEWNRIRDYIRHNQAQWDLDRLNHRTTIVRESITGYSLESWMV